MYVGEETTKNAARLLVLQRGPQCRRMPNTSREISLLQKGEGESEWGWWLDYAASDGAKIRR